MSARPTQRRSKASSPRPAASSPHRWISTVLVRSRADWLRRFPQMPPRREFETFAAVPLLFEDGVSGVMGIGDPDARQFAGADVEVLMAIGRQGAQALERARLYEERAFVARTLQAGLLARAAAVLTGVMRSMIRALALHVATGGHPLPLILRADGPPRDDTALLAIRAAP